MLFCRCGDFVLSEIRALLQLLLNSNMCVYCLVFWLAVRHEIQLVEAIELSHYRIYCCCFCTQKLVLGCEKTKHLWYTYCWIQDRVSMLISRHNSMDQGCWKDDRLQENFGTVLCVYACAPHTELCCRLCTQHYGTCFKACCTQCKAYSLPISICKVTYSVHLCRH